MDLKDPTVMVGCIFWVTSGVTDKKLYAKNELGGR